MAWCCLTVPSNFQTLQIKWTISLTSFKVSLNWKVQEWGRLEGSGPKLVRLLWQTNQNPSGQWMWGRHCQCWSLLCLHFHRILQTHPPALQQQILHERGIKLDIDWWYWVFLVWGCHPGQVANVSSLHPRGVDHILFSNHQHLSWEHPN